MLTRRDLLIGAIGTGRLRADDFPSQPIRVFVGFSAGGGADIIARAIGDVAERFIGQPLMIINKPGASGTIAAREVALAEPDGYTLLIAGGSETACAGHFRKLSYHPIRAFTPLMRVARLGLLLNVRRDAPWTTVNEFVRAARAQPGKFTYASAGYGSLAHATMLIFGQAAGIVLKHLPFSGGAEGLVALRGGHVDVTVAAESESRALAEALQVRSLAVASAGRSPLRPEVPTLREAGFDVSLENQKGFVGPAGLSSSRAQRLHHALKNAFDHPDFVRRCRELGIDRAYLGPDAFGRSLWNVYRQIGRVVRRQ